MKLYEISESYRNIAELLENPEFSESQDVQAALDAVEDDFNHKAVQTVYSIKNAEYKIPAIDAEIKRLQAMKKALQNNVESVKNYLKYNMAQTGIFKISCPVFTITYAERKDGAVEIDEAVFFDNNPAPDLVVEKITPNKTAIKEALKRGESVIGARLVDSQVLSIK